MPIVKNRQPNDIDRIKNFLDYNPETGDFTWKLSRRGHHAGRTAGYCREDGAIGIVVDGWHYLAHRLAWLLTYGYLPDGEIDHRDRNRTNNAINNLRLATHPQNLANRPHQSNNLCGIKGVSKIPKGYRARINHRHLGCFATAEEAHAAYLRAAKVKYGEFARGSE